ncbi:LysR family transcriptional regulator substrate-binding protein [Streptococcus didelphis]|uniref:LysR family transcriptional regulator substrate-binding protein n=1 Tax=Streptococcus didelphis TaxID=102886 RepID=UPI0027D23C4F|nr:LysR family transcriptional regulator substrate-binding protein [Streptococcus didelphis]WMB30190.1 LysR family transcriptional regulator substrate-binding protein [Streptococcus didelphis]
MDILLRDQLCLYMSQKTYEEKYHKAKSISIKDLHHEEFVTFDKTFMIYHQLKVLFEQEHISPKIKLYSASWDFLLNITRYSSYTTILPRPITYFANMEGLVEIPLKNIPNGKWS